MILEENFFPANKKEAGEQKNYQAFCGHTSGSKRKPFL